MPTTWDLARMLDVVLGRTIVKVTLRNSYSYNDIVVTSEPSWEPEMQVDFPIKDIMEMLELQLRMADLQEKLKPLYEACVEKRKVAEENKKLEREEKERLAALEAENTIEDGVAIG